MPKDLVYTSYPRVAVEIGVVMLVYLKQALSHQISAADSEGRPLDRADLKEAVVEGALLRVRPIMMTVAAIIAGLLPIMLGSGTGSEVMRRITTPMVSATILTLAVIPAVFLLWKERQLVTARLVIPKPVLPMDLNKETSR